MEIRNFRSTWKSSNMVFQLQEKKSALFFRKIFFRWGGETASCEDFWQTNWRLNSPAQEEQEKKRKRRTPLVPTEDK